MDNTFSIVIPVYNREKFVARTLDSVLAQSYRPIHIIAVDNNSSDGSLATLRRWKEGNEGNGLTMTIVTETAPGACNARNRGLAEVKSEWMLFFDSDDTMNPELVSDVMKNVACDPGLDLIYWKCSIEMDDGGSRTNHFTLSNLLRRHLIHSVLCTQAYAVRTAFVREAGGWNPDLPAWNDWELGVRLLLKQPATRGIPKVFATIYRHKESISGVDFHSKAGVWEKAIDAIEKVCAGSGEEHEIKSLLLYRKIILAAHYSAEGHPELAENLLRGCGLGNLPLLRRIITKAIYHYTRLGGRAAYLIWR